jgi:hypothetical protein
MFYHDGSRWHDKESANRRIIGVNGALSGIFGGQERRAGCGAVPFLKTGDNRLASSRNQVKDKCLRQR